MLFQFAGSQRTLTRPGSPIEKLGLRSLFILYFSQGVAFQNDANLSGAGEMYRTRSGPIRSKNKAVP